MLLNVSFLRQTVSIGTEKKEGETEEKYGGDDNHICFGYQPVRSDKRRFFTRLPTAVLTAYTSEIHKTVALDI